MWLEQTHIQRQQAEQQLFQKQFQTLAGSSQAQLTLLEQQQALELFQTQPAQ